MSNTGFKILKQGKSASSTDIADYVFWSKYPPLTFLDKVSLSITINSTNGIPAGGTQSYNHGYGFAPLVLAVIEDDTINERFFLPAKDIGLTGLSCDGDHILSATFDYDITSTQVIINYTVYCMAAFMGAGEDPVTGSGTINVDLYFYMWELGSDWPQ